MKELFKKIKEVKLKQDEWNTKDVGRIKVIKAFLGAIFLTLVILFPIALIYIQILKLYSPVLFVHHITLVLICITVYLFVPFTNMLFYAILKNYTEKEEIQKISLKYTFINELLNPFYLIIAILFVLVIKYFIGR